jgi:hypothetical protein
VYPSYDFIDVLAPEGRSEIEGAHGRDAA